MINKLFAETFAETLEEVQSFFTFKEGWQFLRECDNSEIVSIENDGFIIRYLKFI